MNIKSLIITCGLAVCLLVQPAAAGALQDGQAAFDRKDYAPAVQIWRPLADQGDAEVQYNIGLSYMSDDLHEAARWYGLAADQGNAKAQFAIGNIYAVGYGVPKDLVKACKTTALGPHPFGAPIPVIADSL
jgi:TPR repeat protein